MAVGVATDPRQIRSQVLESIDRTPVLSYSLFHLGAAWGQLALLIGLLPLVPDGLTWKAAYFLAMGWTQYRNYFPLHEACHLSLFRHPWANRLAGRVSSSLLFTTFPTFTDIHMRHHRLWGTREDDGAVDYFVRFDGLGSMARFFLGPLLGYHVIAKAWQNLGAPILIAALGRPRAEEKASGRRPRTFADVAILASVQAVVFLGITAFGARPLDYLLFYLFPLATVFVFLARLRMYLEHGPLDYRVSDYLGANARRIARTHAPGRLTNPLFSYMNFGLHHEHHLFPFLPSSRLPEVHQRFVRSQLHPDDWSQGYPATLRSLLLLPSTRAEDPGA